MSGDVQVRAELDAKCHAFLEELDHWQAEIPRLPAHASQIERLVGILKPLGAGVAKRIAKSSATAKAYELSAEVLLLYRVWHFYREKLSQRFVPWQREFLEVADELAYRWWKPAHDAALAAKKLVVDKAKVAREPPLVHLNGDVSPLTLTRRAAFEPERVEGLSPSNVAWARRVIQALPVPTIGVPYFAARYAPDLLLLGHEVGHNVEDDFDLGADLDGAVAKALGELPTEVRDDWVAWTGETFADMWGVLSGGPAFVDSMTAFAVSFAGDVEEERAVPGSDYPPVMLRAECMFEALAHLGLVEEAHARRKAFRARFGSTAARAHEPGCKPVARALLDVTPAGLGRSVRSASAFSAVTAKRAATEAPKIADGRTVPSDLDTATLAQSITRAFMQDPAAIVEEKRSNDLWAALRKTITNGVRSGHASGVDAKTLESADEARVATMLDALTITEE